MFDEEVDIITTYRSKPGKGYIKPKKRTSLQIQRRIINRKNRKLYNKHHPKMRDYRLYALKLEGGKYYIGMTAFKDVNKRYQQHLDGVGAVWTRKYTPIGIIETREVGYIPESQCAGLETNMTIEYIDKYGIDNVRGGALCYWSVSKCQSVYNKIAKVKDNKIITDYDRGFKDGYESALKGLKKLQREGVTHVSKKALAFH